MAVASRRLTAHRRIVFMVAAVCATGLTVFGVLFGVRLSDNFDVVEAGLAYRSGQLWPDELDTVVQQNRIRSIISLSQPQPDKAWYQGEVAISVARHLVRYEMPLSADKELTSDELSHLLTLLQQAPKPVLIHSRSGADSAGLAAAIFRYAVASRSVEEAKNQLSIRYGHLRTDAMDASFQKFVREQKAHADS